MQREEQEPIGHAGTPLVSIVTPLYNEAKHLSECIESVLRQTYTNWDYTIIDNCSTDGSGEIALQYAAKDSRIRVIRNERLLRAYENHNTALQAASPDSKYCKIVFADDWIFPECIERMVAAAEADSSIGIVGAYVLEGANVKCVGLPYPSPIVTGTDVCRGILLQDRYVLGSANSMMYLSDLVRQRTPFFQVDEIHADTEVCFELFKKCNFGFVHQVLTYTRVREESLTAYVSDLGMGFAFRLRLLASHGDHYLTNREIELQTSRHLAEYYRYLGRGFLLRREKKFWDYHRGELLALGFKLKWGRVLVGAVAVLADGLSKPWKSTARFMSLFNAQIRNPRQKSSRHLLEIQIKQ